MRRSVAVYKSINPISAFAFYSQGGQATQPVAYNRGEACGDLQPTLSGMSQTAACWDRERFGSRNL